MKHLITLAIALITAATLSSCGVTTTITYGDISVLDLNGKQIRQWDNCTMDVSVKDNYSGQNLQKTYAIKNGGGLAFTDDSGEWTTSTPEPSSSSSLHPTTVSLPRNSLKNLRR